MSSTLTPTQRIWRPGSGIASLALGVALWTFCAFVSCQSAASGVAERKDSGTRMEAGPVISLGNLRGNAPPSETESRLAEFFFGEIPEPALGLVKPSSVAVIDGDVWVCDSALRTIFKFDSKTGSMSPVTFKPAVQRPVSIEMAGGGDRLVVDLGLPGVIRFDSTGHERIRYVIEGVDFRPADAVEIEGAIWVSNTGQHRIEVFDAATGNHRKSIGRRGSGPLEFGVPLGMATTPRGTVLVVDMLNDRVQELNADGTWRRFIGRPGDQTGCFGRPKDVAVADDGTVFVIDAATQRVHAFDSNGRPLASFGSKVDGGTPLSVPGGLAISSRNPARNSVAAGAREPSSYVLVAEQIREQGIRVYGWLGVRGVVSVANAVLGNRFIQSSVENPHWKADRCVACHAAADGAPASISANRVDQLCLSCHDGKQAVAEAHPVGRVGKTAHTQPPEDWPLVGGRLGCVTCHDVTAHCDSTATPVSANPALLRGEGLGGSVQFCTQCHVDSDRWRISPHAQMADAGGIREETCGFCHVKTPTIPTDGRRPGHPELRATGSNVCLGCHSRHWDYFPEGHTDQLLTETIRRRLAARSEQATTGDIGNDGGGSAILTGDLPTSDGRIACFTCHNPHQSGVFPAGSQMDRRANSAADAERLLRCDRTDLCQTCHSK